MSLPLLGAPVRENDHMTLGVAPRQPDLLCTAARFCEGRVAPGSIYGVLHRGVCACSRPCWLIRSGCQGEFQAGEVAGSGAIEGVAVPVGVQADEVERDR